MVIDIRYLHNSVPEYLLYFTFDQSLEQLADLVLTHFNTFLLRYVFMLFLYICILSISLHIIKQILSSKAEHKYQIQLLVYSLFLA